MVTSQGKVAEKAVDPRVAVAAQVSLVWAKTAWEEATTAALEGRRAVWDTVAMEVVQV